MLREVDLISYLPHFVREYREIQKIMIAENPEIQMVEDETEKVKNNSFILFCDENGIARFERLLNITPSTDDTLDSRKSRVLSRWNDAIPYTFKGLIEKLNQMCGENGYIINPNFSDYEMELMVSLPLSGQADELDYMLSYMIPANIAVTCLNIMNRTVEGKVSLGSTTIELNKFEMTSKLNNEHTVNAFVNNAGTVVTHITRTIN